MQHSHVYFMQSCSSIIAQQLRKVEYHRITETLLPNLSAAPEVKSVTSTGT